MISNIEDFDEMVESIRKEIFDYSEDGIIEISDAILFVTVSNGMTEDGEGEINTSFCSTTTTKRYVMVGLLHEALFRISQGMMQRD